MKSAIKISHVHLETQLLANDEFVQLLIVENPNEFFQFVLELEKAFNDEESLFVFSKDRKIIIATKFGSFVSNLFNFDLNDKKVINLLYKKLELVAFGEQIIKFNELNSKIVNFVEELSFSVPFLLDYEEPTPLDYFKCAGVKFHRSYDSLIEKIICYINALIELKGCEFFVFVNLKSVLDDEKLQQLYNHCKLEKIGLVLIESAKTRPLLPCEKAVIITEDLCEILENYE